MRFVEIIPVENFIYSVVALLFFPVWYNIGLEFVIILPFPKVVGLIIMLLLPLLLLVSVVVYRSRLAYFIVLAIFFLGFFLMLEQLYSSIKPYFNYGLNESVSLGSHCPSCEIEGSLWHILYFIVAIVLLHHKKMKEIYRWKSTSLLIAILAAFLIFLYKFLFFK